MVSWQYLVIMTQSLRAVDEACTRNNADNFRKNDVYAVSAGGAITFGTCPSQQCI